MKTWAKLALLGLICTVGVGCVAQADYDRLKTAYFQEKEQNIDLANRLEDASARIKALQAAAASSNDADLKAQLAQALADKDKLEKAMGDMEARLRALGGTDVVLPASVDAALKDLAASNPDLLTYDPRKGMVKFNADLTFDLGSDTVKPAAAAALAKFATVMKLPDAQRYEALVVGHTDNVRISKASTKARFPDNWWLSVGRAISVKNALQSDGIAVTRFMVGGYGEYRPIVPNGARGAQANRRVEIFLVPSTATATADIAQPATEATPAPTPRPVTPATDTTPPEMFK